jgi:hypothetical protein
MSDAWVLKRANKCDFLCKNVQLLAVLCAYFARIELLLSIIGVFGIKNYKNKIVNYFKMCML